MFTKGILKNGIGLNIILIFIVNTLFIVNLFAQEEIYILDGKLGVGVETPEKPLVVAEEINVIDLEQPQDMISLFPKKIEFNSYVSSDNIGIYRESGDLCIKKEITDELLRVNKSMLKISFPEYTNDFITIEHSTLKFTEEAKSIILSANFIDSEPKLNLQGNFYVDGKTVADSIFSNKLGLGYNATDQIPIGYNLAVKGKILTQELKVLASENSIWPDYVFEKDHDLPELENVESYIEKHKHLPEIPSAKEVQENGINIAEMQAKLLKKIEELTLYVIEIKKRMKN